MDPQEFISAIRLLEKYESVNPYSRVIDLEPGENGQPLDVLKKITRPGRGETDIQKIPFAGGIIMFRKEALIRVGGWSEDYIGWGAEDDYQSFKIKQFLSHIEVPNRCYHLYHEKVKPDMIFYQRNLQLLNKLVTYSPTDTMKYIANSAPKNRFKNKYHDK